MSKKQMIMRVREKLGYIDWDAENIGDWSGDLNVVLKARKIQIHAKEADKILNELLREFDEDEV